MKFKDIAVGIVSIAFSLLMIYGIYWVTKTGSYWLFYEDMVKQTVIEMVKPEALK